MILKMNKDNELYQTDHSFDSEYGIGRIPEMVEDSNVLSLSQKEDEAVLKDRRALLQKRQNEVRRNHAERKRIAAQEKARRKYINKKQDALHLLNQKIATAQRWLDNQGLVTGIKQGHRYLEKMSGISGYGLTASGRKPILDHPAVDHVQIIDAEGDFGMIDQMMDENKAVPKFASTDLSKFVTGPFFKAGLSVASGGQYEPPKKDVQPMQETVIPAIPSESITTIPDTLSPSVGSKAMVHPMLRYGLIPTKG